MDKKDMQKNKSEKKNKNIQKKDTSKKGGKKSNSKIEIKDKKKFGIGILVLFVIIVVVIVLVLNRKTDITNVDDFSKLNSKKYSSELLDKYQTEESKNKFLDEYDYVQGAVGYYIINNSTTDSTSFSDIISKIKEELKNDNWTAFDIDKPTYWNGEWTVTDEGIVMFKFGNKDIEPSWVNDEELTGKIEFN